jgi:hypothetical protein
MTVRRLLRTIQQRSMVCTRLWQLGRLECVRAKAAAYSVLDGTVSDIASAAVSACYDLGNALQTAYHGYLMLVTPDDEEKAISSASR